MNFITKRKELKSRKTELEKQIQLLKSLIEFKKNEFSEEIQFWESALNLLPVSVFIITTSGIEWCNAIMSKQFNLSSDDMKNISPLQFYSQFSSVDYPSIYFAIEHVLNEEYGELSEIKFLNSDGKENWFLASLRLFDYDESIDKKEVKNHIMQWIWNMPKSLDDRGIIGNPKVVGVLICIDERKKIENRLMENEKKYEVLINNLFDMLFIVKRKKIIWMNKSAKDKLEYSNIRLRDIPVNELFIEEYVQNFYEALKDYQTDIFYDCGKFNVLSLSGKKIPVEMKIANILYEEEAANLFLLKDISAVIDRKDEKAYSIRMINLQEEERKKIARELHDNILQILMSALSEINICGLNTFPDLQQKADEVIKIIENSVFEIRRISHNLHPAIIEHIGLRAAILKAIREMKEKIDIKTDFQYDDIIENIPNEAGIFLYRIIQEIFSNVIKHSSASMLEIVCSYRKNNVSIIISDNGKGFSYKNHDQKPDGINFGLLNIRERVNLLNGKLRILSAPGKGTKVIIKIPFIIE